MKYKFCLWKTLKTDANIRTTITLLPFLILMDLSIAVVCYPQEITSKEFPKITLMFPIITLLCCAYLTYKILYLKSFEKTDKVVDGKIFNMIQPWNRSFLIIEVSFVIDNLNCRNYFKIHYSNINQNIHTDSQVKILVKDNNPQKTVITELFYNEVSEE